MKISYICGICVKNDAISKSIQNEINWLLRSAQNDVCLYTFRCDFPELPHKVVVDLSEVAFDPHLLSSDLIVFHFGIYYSLFNLLTMLPLRAKSLVVFHNITPKAFLPCKNHEVADKSFGQMMNVQFADYVLSVSRVNQQVLNTAGIDTPGSVLPLAFDSRFASPEYKPSFNDDVIRLIFIGRFVSSKGPVELLEALHRYVREDGKFNIHLSMVGNMSFSDSLEFEQIQQLVDQLHELDAGKITVQICEDATDEVKQKLLSDADIFVLPTYHEGFCVPILEALVSGCKIVTYDNSNLPDITGGLAMLIPTGDVDALYTAIVDSLGEVSSPQWRGSGERNYMSYKKVTKQYVEQYSMENTSKRFTQFLTQFMAS